MKSVALTAVLLFIWIIFSFILSSIAGLTILNQHILTISSLGSLGMAVVFTVKYSLEAFILFIVLLSYSIYPNARLNIGALVLLEGVAFLYSVGLV